MAEYRGIAYLAPAPAWPHRNPLQWSPRSYRLITPWHNPDRVRVSLFAFNYYTFATSHVDASAASRNGSVIMQSRQSRDLGRDHPRHVAGAVDTEGGDAGSCVHDPLELVAAVVHQRGAAVERIGEPRAEECPFPV
jgi:hypothetical protein